MLVAYNMHHGPSSLANVECEPKALNSNSNFVRVCNFCQFQSDAGGGQHAAPMQQLVHVPYRLQAL